LSAKSNSDRECYSSLVSIRSMRHLTITFLISVALLAARDAHACQRRKLPPAIRLAMADLVVEARVDLVRVSQVIVAPTAVRKGTRPDGQMQIDGVTTPLDAMLRCEGAISLERGRTYLFLLFDRLPGESSWSTIDLIDGIVELKDPVASEILRTNGTSTPWTRGTDGWWLKAIVAKGVFAVDEEIDVLLIFRNATAARRELRYRSWPPSERSACLLEGAGVAGVPVPIAQTDIDEYFARVRPAFDLEIGPGETLEWTLDRITTAARGWGYKERLDFKYYPMKPGSYDVDVTCRGFSAESLRARGLRFAIK
jgi:hypothetical protein